MRLNSKNACDIEEKNYQWNNNGKRKYKVMWRGSQSEAESGEIVLLRWKMVYWNFLCCRRRLHWRHHQDKPSNAYASCFWRSAATVVNATLLFANKNANTKQARKSIDMNKEFGLGVENLVSCHLFRWLLKCLSYFGFSWKYCGVWEVNVCVCLCCCNHLEIFDFLAIVCLDNEPKW